MISGIQGSLLILLGLSAASMEYKLTLYLLIPNLRSLDNNRSLAEAANELVHV